MLKQLIGQGLCITLYTLYVDLNRQVCIICMYIDRNELMITVQEVVREVFVEVPVPSLSSHAPTTPSTGKYA